MALSEQEVLSILLSGYSEDCIYADEYKKLIKKIGYGAYYEVRAFCQSQGAKDIRQWLINKNLYQDIEYDMRAVTLDIDYSLSPEEISARILDTQPLIGEPVIPPEALNKLYKRAQEIFDSLIQYGRRDITYTERDVIALTVVQFVKQRRMNQEEKTEESFWPYIFSRFGFKHENNESISNRLYDTLRHGIKNALLQHGRFFAPEIGTQQYYTSIMLHALSPKQSLEALFEILLFFYINDLELTYTPRDTAFTALTNCIAFRWDKDIVVQEGLSVRSNAMASGLKALFKERILYMRSLCERIVCCIDAYSQNRFIPNEQSTIDMLLADWLTRNACEIHGRLQNERNVASHTAIVSSGSTVRLKYTIEDNKVYIYVPPIRLEEKRDSFPKLNLYQGGRLIYSRTMDVFGRLSWTTHELYIDLEETNADFDAYFDFEIEICYHEGQQLIERNKRLHRQFLLFDESGKECISHVISKGQYYIFARGSSRIDTGEIEPEWIDSEAQFIHFFSDESSIIYIDGYELSDSKSTSKGVRFYSSANTCLGFRAHAEGELYTIYDGTFSLDIFLPDGCQVLDYTVLLDGQLLLLKHEIDSNRGVLSFVPPCENTVKHNIQVKEVKSGRIIGSFRYICLNNPSVSCNQKLIYADEQNVLVRTCFDGYDITLNYKASKEDQWIAIPNEQLDFDLEIKLPIIYGTLDEKNLFTLPDYIWVGDIHDSSCVKLNCPESWTCKLFLGQNAIPYNKANACFELGNFLRGYQNTAWKEDLAITVICTERSQFVQGDMRVLTSIAFEEHFTQSPVELLDNRLMWKPEGIYVGRKADTFRLEVDVPVEGSPFTYMLKNKNTIADSLFGYDFPCGIFPYKVLKSTSRLFAKASEQVLYEGNIEIGAPEQIKMLDKYIYLEKARCWDINTNQNRVIELPISAGCLCNFEFLGYSAPSDEDDECPEYIADMFFLNAKTNQWQPFSNRDTEEFECVNPVHVWFISDNILAAMTPGNDPLMIDTLYNSIVNRKLKLPSSIEKARVLIPDYFEYHIE